MPDIKNNIKTIYKALTSEGYKDLGTEQDFANAMQHEEDRKTAYKLLQEHGYSGFGKDEKEFSSFVCQRPNTNGGTVQAVNSNGSDSGGTVPKGQGVDSQPTPEYLKVFDARQIPEDFKVEGDFVNNPIVVGGKERTMGDVANELYRGYDKDYRTTENNKANAWGRAHERAKAMGLDEDQAAQLVGGVDKLYRENLATDLAEGIYQRMYKEGDPLTNVEDVLYDKDFSQVIADTAAAVGYNNVGAYIEHDLKPALNNMLQKKFGGYNANLHRLATDIDDIRAKVSERERRKAEEKRLKAQAEKYKVLGEKLEREGEEATDRPWWIDFAAATTGGLGTHELQRDAVKDDKYGYQKLAAGRAMQYFAEDALEAINEDNILHTRDTKGVINYVKGTLSRMWRGGKSAATDLRTWDLGFTDLSNASAVMNANEALKKGVATADQKALLNAAALYNVAMSKHGAALEGMYGAVGTSVEMVPLMLQIAANPASGFGKGTQKMVQDFAIKGLTKRFGKYAADATLKTIARRIGYVGRFVGDIGEGAALTLAYGMPSVAADATNRQIGDVQAAIDKKGNVVFNGTRNGETAGKAFAKAFTAHTIDNHSELAGEYFGPILNYVSKGVTKGLNKVGLTKVTDFITGLSNKQITNGFNRFMKKTHWNGIGGENVEEVFGNVENALTVGDLNLNLDVNDDHSVFSKRLNWNTFLGVSVGSGFLSGIHTANYLRNIRKINTAIADADTSADVVLGTERWNNIKAQIDNATADNAAQVMTNIAINEELSEKQAEPIYEYAKNTFVKHGLEIARLKDAVEGNISSTLAEIESQNENGRNAQGALRTKFKNEFEQAEQKLNSTFDEETINGINAVENADEFVKSDAYNGFSEEEKKVALDYLNAKSAYKGMIERVQDDIHNAISRGTAEVDQLTHKDSGEIVPVTLKENNQEVYVISGNVVMTDNGSVVDYEKSDKSLIVFNPVIGKQEMIDAHAVLNIGERVNAEQRKAELKETITQTEAERAANEIETPPTTFEYGQQVKVLDSEGNLIDGEVQDVQGDDVVVVSDAFKGGKVYKAEELARIGAEGAEGADQSDGSDDNQNAQATAQEAAQEAAQATAQATAQEAVQAESAKSSQQAQSAFGRIPKDKQGQPIYEQAEPETAWDAIVEQTGGDEAMAQTVVDDMVADKEAAVKKAERAKTKGGTTIAEKIAAEKERSAAIEQAKQALEHWKKIASTNGMRQAAIQAEENRKAEEAARLRKEQEDKERAAREEAERQKREALNGVPDFVEDKASDARARGYRRVNGDKVDRQAPLAAVQGKDVQVKFDDKNIPSGHVALIDADELQPSHKNGQRNPLHFIDEAQPKERKDDASKEAARKIASNIRPEEITSSVTAYTGAPTVNSRGEVIQGNNRSAALKEMWAAHKDQGEKYKQYLIDHAAELGLNPDEVRAMEKPILVNMLDVNDADAIALGQFVASDTESGGVERIKPKNVVKKLGDKLKNFASILLRSTDEDMSFSELIDRNGVDVLKWLNANGSITPTQYKSAFDSKGNLTAEAKNDLKGVMYQSIFEGGSTHLEEMFNALPAKAQKAILATAYRDYDSPRGERMVEELQNSIMAYYALSHDAQFMAATNHKDARMAVEAWKRQYAIDENTGESYLPAEKYSNFALLLATMYKGDNQSFIQGTFNKLYDLIQGSQEKTLFEQPDNTPRSLVEAIKEILNIDYNGQQRNDVLVGGTTTSQRGEQGSNGASETGGRSEDSDGTKAHQGGTEAESRVTTQEAAQTIIQTMEDNAVEDPNIPLTPQTWLETFGINNSIETPIGRVKMGENQYAKLQEKNRTAEFGMVALTLSDPDVIFIEPSQAKDDNTERAYSYVYAKTFKRNGEKIKYFASVTVAKEGLEISVSSHFVNPNKMKNKLMEFERAYTKETLLPNSSEMRLTEHQSDVPDLLPTQGNNVSSVGKDTQISNNEQGSSVKNEESHQGGSESESRADDLQVGSGDGVQEVHVGLNDNEAEEFISRMEANAVPMPQLKYTQVAWNKQFAKGRKVKTLVGKVKVGDDQRAKVILDERSEPFGVIRPTLTEPLAIIEVTSEATDDNTKRETSLLFVKTFVDKNGKKVYCFKFVTGEEDDMEVNVSNYYNRPKNIKEALKTGKLLYRFDGGMQGILTYKSKRSSATTQANGRKSAKNNAVSEDLFAMAERVAAEEGAKRTRKKEEAKVDTNPTEAQKEAGNYRKGHIKVDGMDVTIEQPKGSVRRGKDAYGKEWESKMHNTYGYIRGTESVDGDHIDIFLSDTPETGNVFVIDQVNKDGSFDEHKVMYGFSDMESAKKAYLSNYEDGWQGLGNITEVSKEEFKKWIDSSKRKTKPFAEYSSVKTEGDVKVEHSIESSERTKPEVKNRLVTDERYEELKKRMKAKLRGQLNMGVDPEMLSIGAEMAVYHIEKGSRAFSEYAKGMIADLGDAIRPYLKAFYNGARDLPEMTELSKEMTPYDEVRGFDVASIGKDGEEVKPSVFDTAEQISNEHQVEQNTKEEAKQKSAKKEDDDSNVNNYLDDRGLEKIKRQATREDGQLPMLPSESSEEVGALSNPTQGLSSDGKDTEKTPNSKGNKKKVVSSHAEGSLFDAAPSLTNKDKDDEVHVRNGGSTAKREQGHEPQQNEPLGESKQDEAERPDGRRMGGRDTTHSRTDAERSGRVSDLSKSKQRLNATNNHGERGVDYAPTSVDARIEANIKAIELANELVESGEKATPEQMCVLRKFSGWGGLGKAFSIGTPISLKLQQLLGAEAYEQAVMSANSAYYTPAYVIDTLWDVAKQLGFKGGNVLEGSAGIGNIIGQMPMDISDNSHIQAVEIDGTSGNILSLLYPEANVEIQGFEQTRVPNGSVDLAITNVPFVTGLRVNDTTGDSDLSKKFHNIHDFCIAKNVRKLRDGGIGIFISSNGTLDNSQKLRDWLVSDGNADVIGAFRLNNKTFGGTGVTSDIIVIRKRVGGKVSPNAIDVSTVTGERSVDYNTGEEKKVKGKVVPVIKHLSMDYNKYFIEHPEMMAGKMAFAFEHGATYRATSKGLYPTSDKQQEELLQDFVNSFAHMKDEAQAMEEEKPVNVYEALGDDVKEGSMLINKDGKLCVAQLGQAVPLGLNTNKVKGHTKEECFKAYTAIKKALDDVLRYQSEHEDDKGLQPLLDKLNKAYDDFVNTYGHFNKNVSISFLRNDVDFPNIFSLERYEETGDKDGKHVQKFSKTDVFSKRVIEKDVDPQPKNVKDGIIVSIYKTGKIDIPYISSQLSMSEDDVKEEIISSGLGFEDPTSKQVVVSYQYLSGNIREKLKQAEANNENGAYNGNIKALKEVVPNSIPAHLIEFNLGSSWIAPELYNEFVKEKTGIDVKFTAAGGTWFMKAPDWGLNNDKNRSSGVYSEVFKEYIYGHKLIEAAIQNKTVSVSKVQKYSDGSTETITDKVATQACASKIDEIRQDFKDWARNKMQSDPAMSERMEVVYNDLFNNYVPVDIPSEYTPEYFGGATHRITLRPHQAKAVVRGTMQPLMLAHEVGTGKTFSLISTAMEMRRLGTARKPMIVVQNATVGQFVASAKQLYPNAKILTLEDSDRNAEGRKNFYAKIRYNDWDMIVVPQSTFEFIPDSEERQMAFIKDKIEERMLVLERMKEADDSERNPITRQAEKEIQQLEGELAFISGQLAAKRTAKEEKKRAVTKQNTEVKAREMLDRRVDDTENFDDMGIDALLIDEAHEYKHLGFATAMQRGVKGIDPSYSKKSQGVYLKTQAVLQKSHGRNVIFATGTPISNTAAEIWTFMRYLMPADTMKDYGIYYFDDFVRNFGNIQQMLEFTTSGKFKENNRFAGYINLPELVRIWSSVSDTVRTKEAGGVSDKIPEMETGKAQDLYLPQTKALRGIMKYVKGELEKYDNMSGKEKKENSHIPLTMYGIAKAAAVDARLVDASAEDDANSKTNEAVRQTLRSLKETASYNGTVALFADNYQNKASGFNLYEDIREKLIKAGVPEKQIVVMKSGMTVKKKLEIFDKVNRGEVRVIMGSTFTLGTGVNIQERLHTLIHLDAPNRPMDYTQRNGRILRQGNIHKEMNKPVRVLRFGVEDSLDVTAYQRLKTKGAIADSIMKGKQLMANSMENRILEEEEDAFGDTVAQLSGSEYAMLKNQAEKNARKFESRKRQWEADQTYIHNAKPRLNGQIKQEQERKDTNEKNLSLVRKTYPNGTFKVITIGKQKFDSVEAMADFIKEHNKKVKDEGEKVKDSANASYTSSLNVNIDGLDFVVRTEVAKDTTRQGVNLLTKSTRKMFYSQKELGLTDVPVKNGLLRNAIEDITENVISGNDFEDSIESAEQNISRYSSELEQMQAREGKPFEFEKELEEAKAKYEEYTELMKQEMEEKEKKYAEMDKDVEAVSTLSEASEDEEDLMRDGQGTLPNDANRAALAERERSRMTHCVEELADTLHLDNVEVVTDASQLEGNRAKAKGFYSKRTGKITIVVPNHANVADIEKTLLHEAVAHYGLRELFGEAFDDMIESIFMQVDEATRLEIMRKSSKRGWDYVTATEEYLASMAEDMNFEHIKPSVWQRIKHFFGEMLSAVGLHRAELTDNDLRYILWRSYENLKRGGKRGIFDAAEDVAMQYRLKVGNYAVSDLSDQSDGSDLSDGSDEGSDEEDEVAEASVGLDEVNERFNDALQQQIDGTLPKGYVYDLGMPSSILLSTGIPNLPIQLNATRLKEKATSFGHDFDLSEIKNLVKSLQHPMAIFKYGDERKAQNIVIELQQGDKNFIVGLSLHPTINGRELHINSIRNVFPKDNAEWLNWISQGKLLRVNKEKVQNLINQQRTILADVDYLDLDSIAKIIKDFENRKLNDDILYREVDPTESEVLPDARTRYEREVRKPNKEGSVKSHENLVNRLHEAYVDSMAALRSYMDSVLEATGDELSSHEEAYKAENAMSSKNKSHREAYDRDYYVPMLEAAHELCQAAQIGYDALKMYIVAKHGLERNAYMREKEIERVKNDENLSDEAKSDLIFELEHKDYSGLTALFGLDKTCAKQAEEEAEMTVYAIESNLNAKPKVVAFWKRVNAATKATLKNGYESGIMTKETYEHIRDMFDYYVPLRGWDEAVASDVYTYYGGRFGTGEPLMKTAKGRTSLAEDPLAMIGDMAQRNIDAANRNKMKQAFLNFTFNHPTNLASVGEQWYTKNAFGKWERHNLAIPANASADAISKLIEEDEMELRKLAKEGSAIRQRNGLELDLRTTKGEQAEHVVKVWRGGKEYVIYINGNPAVAQAINGMTNPDKLVFITKDIDKLARSFNRGLAALFTSHNPAFAAANFCMDQIFASQAVYVKYGKSYKRAATKNAISLFIHGELPKLVYRWEHGTLDLSNPIDKYFDEFMRNGGETGFTALRDITDYKKQAERIVGGKKGFATRIGLRALLDGVEFANRTAEDFSRFVVFMTSRQRGKAISEAIFDAKDITVNFNKKGSGSMGARFCNFAYIFFNAAVQSASNFYNMGKLSPKRMASILSKFSGLGACVPFLNIFLMGLCGADDEAYWDNMEWVRRNHILLYVPGTKRTFVSIPLPHELRPFYGIGEILATTLMGKEDVGSGLLKAVEGFTGMLPVDFTGNGGNLILSFMPSFVQPIAQWRANTDYFGKKIYNDNPNKAGDPEWTKAFKSANPILVDITEWLNKISGGDEAKRGKVDLNPDVINYFIKGYFGGPAKIISQTSSFLYKLFSGNSSAIQWRDVPVGSRFVQQIDERSSGSYFNESFKKFADEVAETQRLEREYKRLVRLGKREYAEKIDELLRSPEYSRYKIAKGYNKSMDLVREVLKHIDDTTDREAVEGALQGLRRCMMEVVNYEHQEGYPTREEDYSYTGEILDDLTDDLRYAISELKEDEADRLEDDYSIEDEEEIKEDKEAVMKIINVLKKLAGKEEEK